MRELYQDVILDHNRKPRNFRKMDDANRTVRGHNPLCGDKLVVYMKVDGDRVADLSFEGAGCAISTASASMMTQALKGQSVHDAVEIFRLFHAMLTGERSLTDDEEERLGKLAAFAGVCQYPARVKCATLAWHTAHAALCGAGESVSTE